MAAVVRVAVEQRMIKKCAKIYNALTQPLFLLLNLLFGGVLVAVAVMVYFSSLFTLIFFISPGHKVSASTYKTNETRPTI